MLAIITNLLKNIPPSPHPHSHPRKKIFQIPWYWNIQEKIGDKPKKFPPGVTRSNQTRRQMPTLPHLVYQIMISYVFWIRRETRQSIIHSLLLLTYKFLTHLIYKQLNL